MAITTEPESGTATVVGTLRRPYEPVRVTAALLGLTPRAARQIIGTVLATSEEAERLVEAMPRILRSLAIATTDQPERCYGELRGPVLWSETMSARSSSAGDPGLFVCATTTKAYDTDENRVLKYALHSIHSAAHDAGHGHEHDPDEVVRRAKHNGHEAGRLLEHQTLADVPVITPRGRALHRTRAGSRRSTYAPALAFIQRTGEPLTAAQLWTLADDHTRADHDLLAATLAAVGSRTDARPALHSHEGGLRWGAVSYLHAARSDADQRSGVRLDAPDGTREAIVVSSLGDVARAVTAALG